MRSEILIVGGGVVGLALAWRLRRAGAAVAVVERGRCGGATSSASAGLVQSAPDVTAAAPALLPLALAAHRAWPDDLRELESAAEVPVGRAAGRGARGILVASLDETDDEILDARAERYRANDLPVERLTAEGARRKEWSLGPAVRGALFLKGDFWVNPVALGAALLEAFRRAGGRTYERERVIELVKERGGDGARIAGVRTRTRFIPADTVVLAAGAWSGALAPPEIPPGTIAASRGQALALDARTSGGAPFLQRAVSSPSVWAVPQNDGRLWVGGVREPADRGGSLDPEPCADTTARILAAAGRLAPGAERLSVLGAAVGLPSRTPDRMPILGPSRATEGLHFTIGHYRAGILLAFETARMVAPAILRGDGDRGERLDPALDPFSPERFRPSSARP